MVSTSRRAAPRRAPASGGSADLGRAVDKLGSDSAEERAGACAVLAMKANLPDVDGTELAGAVPRLVELLRSDTLLVKVRVREAQW